MRDLFLAAMEPAHRETLLGALDALEQERQATERQWQLRLERARYAVRLAERQDDAVDPENSLVARELERRGNAALEDLGQVERDYAAARRTALAPLSSEEQQAVRRLTEDLPRLWAAPTTTATDRKRLLRLVMQEVSVSVTAGAVPRQAQIVVLWSGGAPTTTSFAYPVFDASCGYIVGVMTVRKERRQRGSCYWSAYRRHGGRLRKVYLGSTAAVTRARLAAAACSLTTPQAPPPAPRPHRSPPESAEGGASARTAHGQPEDVIGTPGQPQLDATRSHPHLMDAVV